MKLVYTNENRFLVENARNILQNARIAVSLKNEYAGGGAGDLAVFETWLELWVVEDEDFKRAEKLLDIAFNRPSEKGWICEHCDEKNDASFEICWHCQGERN